MGIRYAIITNPVSGKMTVGQKRSALAKAAEILRADIHGLDTATPEDFRLCAHDLAGRCDVLVVAGGDGTFSDIINAIDTRETVVAYLPLGTGNAMGHALHYRGNLAGIAMRIKEGETHGYDLINCDEKRRAFMASVGLDGTIIQLRNHYLAQGGRGFKVYLRAIMQAYFREYKPRPAKMTIDGSSHTVKKLLTLMVVKQPYYGFGAKVMPRARFDDGQIHIRYIRFGLFHFAAFAVTSLTVGNRVGRYCPGRDLTVNLEHPLKLQIDGNDAWEAKTFTFKILPKALKIKC